MLLSPEYIKQRRKRRQWLRPWIRKRDSKEAYYSIINDLRLTDKENFIKYLRMNIFILHITILQKSIGSHSYTFILFKWKLKLCVSFFSILYKHLWLWYRWTLFIKKIFTTHACFYFYVMEFRKQKSISCTSAASLCFTQKNNFCIINKIKLVWFYSLYRNYSFE